MRWWLKTILGGSFCLVFALALAGRAGALAPIDGAPGYYQGPCKPGCLVNHVWKMSGTILEEWGGAPVDPSSTRLAEPNVLADLSGLREALDEYAGAPCRARVMIPVTSTPMIDNPCPKCGEEGMAVGIEPAKLKMVYRDTVIQEAEPAHIRYVCRHRHTWTERVRE